MNGKKTGQVRTILILFLTMGLLGTGPEAFASETDDIGRCDSITIENAATILAVSAAELTAGSTDLMVSPEDLQKKIYKIHPCTCRIRSTSNFLKSIAYVTYVYSEAGQAHTAWNTMRQDFSSISKVDVVPGLGDEAFWVGDDRFQRMVAVKHGVLIDVLSPRDFNLQKQVMRLILDKF